MTQTEEQNVIENRKKEEIAKFQNSLGTPSTFEFDKDPSKHTSKDVEDVLENTYQILLDFFHESVKRKNKLRRIKEIANTPIIIGHKGDIEIVDELLGLIHEIRKICNKV